MITDSREEETGSAIRGSAMRELGSVIVMARLLRPAAKGAIPTMPLHSDAVALQLPAFAPTAADHRHVNHAPAGGMLFALFGDDTTMHDVGDGLVLLLPRRLVSAVMPGRTIRQEVPYSAALDALRRLAAALLRLDDKMTNRQARLAGSALCELLGAALAPFSSGSVTLRREASLLSRVVDHVDRNLAGLLEPAALCHALSCSRSALYRAVAPAGGVAALINERRLAAVYARLCDPAERRSVAAVARTCGFDDATRFSRSFKRTFGITPGALRRGHAGEGRLLQ